MKGGEAEADGSHPGKTSFLLRQCEDLSRYGYCTKLMLSHRDRGRLIVNSRMCFYRKRHKRIKVYFLGRESGEKE